MSEDIFEQVQICTSATTPFAPKSRRQIFRDPCLSLWQMLKLQACIKYCEEDYSAAKVTMSMLTHAHIHLLSVHNLQPCAGAQLFSEPENTPEASARRQRSRVENTSYLLTQDLCPRSTKMIVCICFCMHVCVCVHVCACSPCWCSCPRTTQTTSTTWAVCSTRTASTRRPAGCSPRSCS